MRKTLLLWALIGIICAAVLFFATMARADEIDGRLWANLKLDQKIFYIRGWYDGMANGIIISTEHNRVMRHSLENVIYKATLGLNYGHMAALIDGYYATNGYHYSVHFVMCLLLDQMIVGTAE